MKVAVQVISENLSKEQIVSLLQAIRDCEQKQFKDTPITILLDVPEATVKEAAEILNSVKPPLGNVKYFDVRKEH